MWKCKCNTENDDKDDYCIECASPKPPEAKMPGNHCSNPKCKAFNVILTKPEQKYCGKCGSATTYWKEIEDLC